MASGAVLNFTSVTLQTCAVTSMAIVINNDLTIYCDAVYTLLGHEVNLFWKVAEVTSGSVGTLEASDLTHIAFLVCWFQIHSIWAFFYTGVGHCVEDPRIETIVAESSITCFTVLL